MRHCCLPDPVLRLLYLICGCAKIWPVAREGLQSAVPSRLYVQIERHCLYDYEMTGLPLGLQFNVRWNKSITGIINPRPYRHT